MRSSKQIIKLVTAVDLLLALVSNFSGVDAFARNYPSPTNLAITANSGMKRRLSTSALWYTETPDTFSDMDTEEVRKELESNWSSTATETAESSHVPEESIREGSSTADGRQTVRDKWSAKWEQVASAAKETLDKFTKESRANDQGPDFASGSNSSPSSKEARTHQERYKLALEEGRAMRNSSLKKELQDRGISTSSFFDKKGLVEAYAYAIANDIRAESTKGHSASKHKKQSKFDSSYRDVTMHTFDPRDLMEGDIIIDITGNVA